MAIAALLFLVFFSVDVLIEPRGATKEFVRWAMIVTYVVFVIDYVGRLYLAEGRLRWVVRHLFDLAIIALPALRPLRLLSLAVVIKLMQRAIGHTIRGKVVVYTTFGAIIIIYAASLAILQAERATNPDIRNFGDALWWSFTTVTTVGYGDIVPHTVTGRFVAIALMVAGVSLFGVVTATLASWIVERVAEEDTASQAASAAQLDRLQNEIRELTAAVSRSKPDGRVHAYGEADDPGVDGKVEDD